jgi:hypothetical protein
MAKRRKTLWPDPVDADNGGAPAVRPEPITLRPRRYKDKGTLPPGRPKGVPSAKQGPEPAARAAARRVAVKQKAWRKQHGRKRVPHAQTKRMIREVIKEMAAEHNVSIDDVLRELQTGRIKPAAD